MQRRSFITKATLAAIGSAIIKPSTAIATTNTEVSEKVKNIIFMVSDGMSHGTLAMANIIAQLQYKRPSHWMQLYADNKATRALMDTASDSSLVTDSAAASSSWGGGKRVPNGSLNVNRDGSSNIPILQKFKQKGKSVGCITTVPITHATPAGFCIAAQKRNDQEHIAELYAKIDFDLFLGGGLKYFAAEQRKDKVDLLAIFKKQNYQILSSKKELMQASNKKAIGLFADDALPYSIDANNDTSLKEATPTLAEMLTKGLDILSQNKNGFFVQVEAGKVDWAAHANDAGALIYDQLAFDDAIKVAIDFADKNNDTLVVITTDHGNANPGVFYGENASEKFKKILSFTQSNDAILNGIKVSDSATEVIEKVAKGTQTSISNEEAEHILSYYKNLSETGVYNYKKLPYKYLGELLKKYTNIGFGDMDHSGDHVELAFYGNGKEHLTPFIKNHEIHKLLLDIVLP